MLYVYDWLRIKQKSKTRDTWRATCDQVIMFFFEKMDINPTLPNTLPALDFRVSMANFNK